MILSRLQDAQGLSSYCDIMHASRLIKEHLDAAVMVLASFSQVPHSTLSAVNIAMPHTGLFTQRNRSFNFNYFFFAQQTKNKNQTWCVVVIYSRDFNSYDMFNLTNNRYG